MIELNIVTAVFINLVLLVFGMGIQIIVFYKYHNIVSEIKYFLGFYVFQILGMLLVGARDLIPDFLSVIVGNTFIVLGSVILAQGIYSFKRILFPRKIYMSGLLFFVTFMLVFLYVFENVTLRIVLFSVFHIIIFADLYYREVFIGRSKKTSLELMSTILGLILITMIFRLVLVFITHENYGIFSDYDIDAYAVLVLGVLLLLITIGMLTSINSRFNKLVVESERSKESLLSNLPGFAFRCDVDKQRKMQVLSSGFKETTGYDADLFLNGEIKYSDIIKPEHLTELKEKWNVIIEYEGSLEVEYVIELASGEEVWVLEQGNCIYDNNGNVIALEGFITNINERVELEKSLKFMSYRDKLTGLYNRRFIQEELERIDYDRNYPISIIMIDVNGLKFTNDSFGHERGDKLITLTADALKNSFRSDELIARIGGDEFTIVLPKTSLDEAGIAVKRIETELQKKEYQDFGLSIAIGYSCKTSSEQTIGGVQTEADNLMYSNKMASRAENRRKELDYVIHTLYEIDPIARSHMSYVSEYTIALAKAYGLPTDEESLIYRAAAYHDVGKISIDETIFAEEGDLNETQYAQVRKHSETGYRILNSVEGYKDIANIVYCHHERVDGTGYPRGLSDDIPIESRIITIADAYQSMTSFRPYKDKMTKKEAIQELIVNKGKQFDSELVDIFVNEVVHDLKSHNGL